MATRILIANLEGAVLFAMDGHHGPDHAAQWLAATLADLERGEVSAVALEWTPSQGGDHCRCEVVGQIHRLRIEFHRRPDGLSEVVGLSLFPPADVLGQSRAAVGVGRGLLKRQAAGTARPVTGGLRLIAAPDQVIGTRHAIRKPRGRLAASPGHHQESRIERLRARAQRRGSP